MENKRSSTNRPYSNKRKTHRRTYTHRNAEKTDIREKILIQCIVSGVILFIALSINFVKTDFTLSVKNSLKSTLSTETNPDNLMDQAAKINNMMSNIRDSVQGIFVSDQVVNYSDTSIHAGEYVDDNADFRIDEEILERINDTEKKRLPMSGEY